MSGDQETDDKIQNVMNNLVRTTEGERNIFKDIYTSNRILKDVDPSIVNTYRRYHEVYSNRSMEDMNLQQLEHYEIDTYNTGLRAHQLVEQGRASVNAYINRRSQMIRNNEEVRIPKPILEIVEENRIILNRLRAYQKEQVADLSELQRDIIERREAVQAQQNQQ